MHESLIKDLEALGAIGIVRIDEADRVVPVVEALMEGGLGAVEITMTVPGALESIEAVAREHGDDVILGVGSVLDADIARRAVDVGARYVVSPIFKKEVIDAAHEAGAAAMPAAFSPTEAQAAHEAGADVIKLFPADHLGIAFMKSVLAPLPHLKFMPTGGITIENATDWLNAGARMVGLGSSLLDNEAIAEGRYEVLRDNARRLRERVEALRAAV